LEQESNAIKEVIPDLDDLLARSTEEQMLTELPSLQLEAC
jgi:hypothetical protein